MVKSGGQRKLIWHQAVLFALLLLISGWRLLTGRWQLGLPVLWWFLGGVLGFLFVFTDRLIQTLVTNADQILSTKIKELFAEGKIGEGLAMLLSEREKQNRLIMRSALFVVLYLILAFWAGSTATNYFGRGFVLGIGIHLVFDLWWDVKVGEEKKWFWQIRRDLERSEMRVFALAVLVVFLLLLRGL